MAQQAMETMAELGRESSAERSCQTTEEKQPVRLDHMQLSVSTFTADVNTSARPAHLYGALVVVGNVQEHGMGDRGRERAKAGLVEGSYRLASVPVHQPALLVAVASRHGLCGRMRTT